MATLKSEQRFQKHTGRTAVTISEAGWVDNMQQMQTQKRAKGQGMTLCVEG
jgi:hypothetical protein